MPGRITQSGCWTMAFEKGVRWYSTGTAHVRVHFPEGQKVCKWCAFCRPEKEMGRYFCRLTNQMLYAPDVELGIGCPIEFDEITEKEKTT